MRTITLHISEQVFGEMRNAMTIRMISGGAYGIMDGVIGKILDAIKRDQDELNLQYKTEVDDERTDKREE